MVADQPLLQKSSVEKLLTLWKDNPDRIVGAAHNGTRGNPNIFPKEFFPALLSLEGDRGGNGIIRQNPDRVLLVEIHKNELADVDTKGAFIEISKATPF
jgi:molybdenum cofactor cytidylyltransferase